MLYLCTRSGAIIWLEAHVRVFIEQFIAERGIEYGLQIVTRKFLNPPDCLYLKKSCKFLQSYEKLREEQNKLICFFFRDRVVSLTKAKKFAIFDGKDTKKTREMQSNFRKVRIRFCYTFLRNLIAILHAIRRSFPYHFNQVEVHVSCF